MRPKAPPKKRKKRLPRVDDDVADLSENGWGMPANDNRVSWLRSQEIRRWHVELGLTEPY